MSREPRQRGPMISICLVVVALYSGTTALDVESLRNKIVSLGTANKKSYVKHVEKAVRVEKGMDSSSLKKDRKEATWKLATGLSNVEGVSIESTLLPGYYLRSEIPSKVQMDSGKVVKSRYDTRDITSIRSHPNLSS